MNQSMKWNYECSFKNDVLRAFIYLSKLSWKRQTKGLNAFYSQKYLTDTNFMNILYTSLSIFHGHVSTIVCNSGRESSIRESAWKNSRNEGRTQRRNRFLPLLADILFISSFDAPAAVPFAFGSRAPRRCTTALGRRPNVINFKSGHCFSLHLARCAASNPEPFALDTTRNEEGLKVLSILSRIRYRGCCIIRQFSIF